MNKRAFTLLELVVTIIIISLLASLAMPRLSKMITRTYAVEAVQFLKAARYEIDRCFLINNIDSTRASFFHEAVWDCVRNTSFDNIFDAPGARFRVPNQKQMRTGWQGFCYLLVVPYKEGGGNVVMTVCDTSNYDDFIINGISIPLEEGVHFHGTGIFEGFKM